MTRLIVIAVLLLLVIALGAWIWYGPCAGVTHREIKDVVGEETSFLRKQIDERSDAIEARLDRIEGKLDTLIRLATPKLPDGLKLAE